MKGDCVIDASVGIKLFLDEEFSEAADQLFERLKATPPANLYVPDLFYAECTNVLWKYVRRFGYPAENARQDVADLRNLALHSVSMADLIEPALELALAYEISVYDATYAALAQWLSLPLYTADRPLQSKLANSNIVVQTLA